MNINELISTKQYEKAISECKGLIADAELDDDHAAKLTGLVYLGIIYTHQGNYQKSKELFDTHLDEIISECKYYWTGKELTETYIYYYEIDKAIRYNQAYLEHNQNDEKAFITQGHLLFLNKDYGNALNVLEKFTHPASNNALAYYIIGLINQEQNKQHVAFGNFEKAFDLGMEDSIYKIIALLFTRSGTCKYESCTDSCCKGVVLTGVNGKPISNEESFKLLLKSDARNTCWYKSNVNALGNWMFECKYSDPTNTCSNYEMRPQSCRDYPFSILKTRPACSFEFILNDDFQSFSSANTLKVVLHLLKGLNYLEEMNRVAHKNQKLLASNPS